MGKKKLEGGFGMTDSVMIEKVKRGKGKYLNDETSLGSQISDSKGELGNAHLLSKLDLNNGKDAIGIEKEKKRKRKEKNKQVENSTSFSDSCNWDVDKEHELGHGNSKKKAKEASSKELQPSSGADTDEDPARSHVSTKKKKRENIKEDTVEKRDKNIAAAKANNAEKRSSINEANKCKPKNKEQKGKKKVSFSNKVDNFPSNQSDRKETNPPDDFVWGKRFTPHEDELIRQSIRDYIKTKQLGEQGLEMILNYGKYKKQIEGCWNVIGAALPWRHYTGTYARAHTILERSDERRYEPEELELIKRYYAEYGPKWKEIAAILGKSRLHVKDAWRRIKPLNLKKGRWSHDEYQALFDLVNHDLRLNAFEEKKVSHAMLRDNISWDSISNKMSSRGAHSCCLKWYNELASPMIRDKCWNDLDDYNLIEALQNLDACCFEDVVWDNLLEHRSGEHCKRRWHEMIRHIDKFWALPFAEQVDILSEQYPSDMIPYRENLQKMNQV